jgi:hypothetical protein
MQCDSGSEQFDRRLLGIAVILIADNLMLALYPRQDVFHKGRSRWA